MKNIDKKLELIAKADFPDFPLSDIQVRTVFDKVDSDNSGKYKLPKGIKKMATISTILLTALVSLLYFFTSPSNDNRSQYIANNNNKEKSTNNETNHSSETNSDLALADDLKNSTARANSDKIVYDISDEGSLAKDRDTLEILVLTDKELENIFIHKKECGYSFIWEPSYPVNQTKQQMEELKAKGYPKKGYKRTAAAITYNEVDDHAALKYEGWDMEKSPGIFPIYIKLRNYENGSDKASIMSNRAPTQVVEENGVNICNNIFYYKWGKVASKLIKKDVSNSVIVAYNKSEREAMSSVVQVMLKIEVDSNIAIVLLTFPKTQNLISLLPARYNLKPNEKHFSGLGGELNLASIRSSYKDALSNIKFPCNQNFVDKHSLKKPSPEQMKSIGGVETITLSKDEAMKVSISFEQDSISVITEEWLDLSALQTKQMDMLTKDYDYPVDGFALVKQRMAIPLGKIDEKRMSMKAQLIKYSGWDMMEWSPFAPVVVFQNKQVKQGVNVIQTHTFQSPWLWDDTIEAYFDSEDLIGQDSNGRYVPLISRILPISFTNNYIEENGDTVHSRTMLWFYISKEFAERLPSRYSEPILRELELIAGIENGAVPATAACEILKGEKSYFGLCNIGNGDIFNYNIFPNPVTDGNLTLNFSLKKAGKIKIDLFDLNGTFIDTMNDSENYPQGKSSVALTFPPVSDGVYLMTLTDERNNKVIIKIIH